MKWTSEKWTYLPRIPVRGQMIKLEYQISGSEDQTLILCSKVASLCTRKRKGNLYLPQVYQPCRYVLVTDVKF